MMFYLSNVAIAVNISQPSVRIGGGLHALIHIYFLHGGSKSSKPFRRKRHDFAAWHCSIEVRISLYLFGVVIRNQRLCY